METIERRLTAAEREQLRGMYDYNERENLRLYGKRGILYKVIATVLILSAFGCWRAWPEGGLGGSVGEHDVVFLPVLMLPFLVLYVFVTVSKYLIDTEQRSYRKLAAAFRRLLDADRVRVLNFDCIDHAVLHGVLGYRTVYLFGIAPQRTLVYEMEEGRSDTYLPRGRLEFLELDFGPKEPPGRFLLSGSESPRRTTRLRGRFYDEGSVVDVPNGSCLDQSVRQLMAAAQAEI